MIFAPVFFALIGIKANFTNFNTDFILFGIMFIIAGILGKLLGCGVGALACRFSFKDSLRVGIGMMVRAEVLLVCISKGEDAHIIDSEIVPYALILIILTTLLTPIFLKMSYKKSKVSCDDIECNIRDLTASMKGEESHEY